MVKTAIWNQVSPRNVSEGYDDMLEGVGYAHAVMDDILVAGRDIAHHNAVLNEVLARAKSHNLKLNFDKVKVRKQEVPYRGHIISSKGLKADPEKVRAMRDMPNPTTDLSHSLFLIIVRDICAVFLRYFQFEISHWSVWNDQ